MQNLSDFKKSFDKDLKAFLRSRLAAYKKLGKGTLVPEFIDQNRIILLAGGKRFRPYLLELAFASFGGGNESSARSASLAVELFHAFALAHDDIVDKAAFRHGAPTAHAYATERLRQAGRNGDVRHVGQSQGMLAGDLVLVWAFELFYNQRGSANKLAFEAFLRLIDEVFVGEMIDIDMSTKKAVTLAEIRHKHILKTARYSFVWPLSVGARLASGTRRVDKFAKEFGEALGLAFQIQDDVLDVLAATTGKPALADVQERQFTYVTHFLLSRAKPSVRKVFATYFGKTLTATAKRSVTELARTSGALEFAAREAATEFERARKLLARGSVPAALMPVWSGLIDLIERRAQ